MPSSTPYSMVCSEGTTAKASTTLLALWQTFSAADSSANHQVISAVHCIVVLTLWSLYCGHYVVVIMFWSLCSGHYILVIMLRLVDCSNLSHRSLILFTNSL